MKKYFILVLLLVIFTSSAYLAYTSYRQQKVKAGKLNLSGRVEGGIRVIELKASRYKFEPDPIVVRLGERVRLVVTSLDVAHGLAISKFKVNLSVGAGKTETVEFVADKRGTFHTHCSVYCGPGHGSMHGRLIVQ